MEIQKRILEKKLTYAEAAKQVRGQTKDQRVQSGVPTEGNNEVLEEYIMVKKKKNGDIFCWSY